MFSWIQERSAPLIVAHRGSSIVAPENTMAAFRQAVRDGADAIELDVRLTSDDTVIVIHDSRLDRTTDGRGKVRLRTLGDLRGVSAGSWFHQKYSAESVPTLDELLLWIRGERIGLNIELKADRTGRKENRLAELTAALLLRHGLERRVMVSSFHYRLLRTMRELMPEMTIGLLLHPVRHAVRTPVSLARKLRADYIITSGAQLRKRMIGAAHRHAVRIGEYTVNSRSRLDRAVRFGVDMVITDDPARIRKLVS
jgi:glycerophosphoryl diester phosphodiesterase